MNSKSVVVLGAGGHAKVTLRVLELLDYDILGVYDDDPGKHGKLILDYVVRGSLEDALKADCKNAVLAIGDNATRWRVAARFPDLQWITAIHPNAWVDPSASIGIGTVIFAGAVIQADTTIGKHAIINTCASVDHDCVLGNYTHIAPGAHLAGQVIVGIGGFVGIGAVVIPSRRIGDWAVIGAGGVVVRDVPDHVIAVGAPARAR